MTALLLDHLWQSTLFAAAAGLVTLAFAANSAGVRFWLWFAASVKFLIPFSVLTALGGTLFQAFAPKVAPPVFSSLHSAAEPFSAAAEPFSGAVPAFAPPLAQNIDWTLLFLSLWALGFAVILVAWLGRWFKLRAALAGASLLPMDAPMPVKSSAAMLEPGLIGIWRPVLLLPEGIENALSPAEMRAILAHEACHFRRRDNLLAAINMGVQALFWFHPLVWWLGTRLIAERENACDEAVLASGNDPQIYAEGILKVCRFYLHSPLACASGVSGADLRKRIETIMKNDFVIRIGIAKKSLLSVCAASAFAVPLAVGLLTTPPAIAPVSARAADRPHPGTEAAVRHQIESLEEKGQQDYDVMVPSLALAARIQSDRAEANIQKWGAYKSIAFWGNENGNDVYSVEFENQLTVWTIGPLQQGGKIGPVFFFGSAIRRQGHGASPGLAAAIRRDLDGNFTGNPALEIMAPVLQAATQAQWPVISTDAQSLGAVKTIAFQDINPRGWDVYHVTFANGSATIQAEPLTDGKLSGIMMPDILLPHQPQHPGTEALLRRYIESLENGQPDYDEMAPVLAAAVKQQLPNILVQISQWGALRAIVFKGGGSEGVDVYDVSFAHGSAEWDIAPLTAEGKVERSAFHPLP